MSEQIREKVTAARAQSLEISGAVENIAAKIDSDEAAARTARGKIVALRGDYDAALNAGNKKKMDEALAAIAENNKKTKAPYVTYNQASAELGRMWEKLNNLNTSLSSYGSEIEAEEKKVERLQGDFSGVRTLCSNAHMLIKSLTEKLKKKKDE